MLDVTLKEQLKATMQHLKAPIVLKANLDDSTGSTELRSLLEEVGSVSSKISVSFSEGEGRAPSFSVAREGQDGRVEFAGLPLGHEFTSLVLALLHVSGHPPRVPEERLAQGDALEGNFYFETYFSQSCQNCPDAVQALNLLAARNESVTHVAIDGALFQEEVKERQVMAVPTIYLNGKPFAQGRMELEEVLAKIDVGATERQAKELEKKDVFDVLVVGGGPAGAAAAIYAARKGIRTGVVADRFGGQVLDTLAIENFVSVSATEGPKFAAALEAHVNDYPVDVMKHQRVRKVEPGVEHRVELESGATLRARSLVIATSAKWRNMNVPGEEEYRTRGVTYCPHCDGPLFRGKRVAVIGGGNSGVEAAIDLAGVVSHVTVLEFADELKADSVLVRKLESLENVEVILSARTTEVLGDGDHVTGLTFENRGNKEIRSLDVEGIFVQIGLAPNTDFLRGIVDLSAHGEIEVNPKGETSVPGIFAAGDVTTVPFKQIIIATGDGAKASLGAFEHLIRTTAPAA